MCNIYTGVGGMWILYIRRLVFFSREELPKDPAFRGGNRFVGVGEIFACKRFSGVSVALTSRKGVPHGKGK